MAPLDGPAEPVDAVIFVDIDGVLNIGARDKDDAPLLFNASNIEFARTQRRRGQVRSRSDEECIEKLLSIAGREIEEGSYTALACEKGSHVSEVLAERLARIITAAGPRRCVVLASNWRKPQHAGRVRRLEAMVGGYLGEDFSFDARTRPADEKRACDRLRIVGEHVESLYREGSLVSSDRPLRILVLEDFFITPLDGWECGGVPIFCAEAAEAYLRDRAPAAASVEVRLVHTYDEWTTPGGLRVQVGSGLSERQTRQAAAFIGAYGSCSENPEIVAVMDDPQHVEACLVPISPKVHAVNVTQAAQLRGRDRGQALQPKVAPDAQWLNYISGAWPWLSVYLPCAA